MANHTRPALRTAVCTRGENLAGAAAVTHPSRDSNRPTGARPSLLTRAVAALAVLAAVLTAALATSAPASAQSGSGYNNTLPYETGCGSGAYVISSQRPWANGPIMSMVYSPRCGTNWVEWYAPDTNYYVQKWMWGPVQTTSENDWGSWSYSRQVYAPGTTVAKGAITFGQSTIGWMQNWSVVCGSTCTWTRVD